MLGARMMMAASAGEFLVNGLVFDGSNDYMTRGADLTSISDGKAGTLSVWVNLNGGDGSEQHVLVGGSSGTVNFGLIRTTGNKWQLFASGSTMSVVSTTSFTASGGWHHILCSWNLATPEAYLYINGSDDEAGGSTETDTNIDYTPGDYAIGAKVNGAGKLNADLAEVFFHTSFIDITSAANRAKFRDASGKPVNLGADGSSPLGAQPYLYLSNRPGDAASAFATNRGTGGDFSITGTLATASTSPSD